MQCKRLCRHALLNAAGVFLYNRNTQSGSQYSVCVSVASPSSPQRSCIVSFASARSRKRRWISRLSFASAIDCAASFEICPVSSSVYLSYLLSTSSAIFLSSTVQFAENILCIIPIFSRNCHVFFIKLKQQLSNLSTKHTIICAIC